jgi:hypothetical protein
VLLAIAANQQQALRAAKHLNWTDNTGVRNRQSGDAVYVVAG